MKYRIILLVDSSILFSSIENECLLCIVSNCKNDEYNNIICPKDKQYCRISYQKLKNAELFVCSKSENKSSNFKNKVGSISAFVPHMIELKNGVILSEQKRIGRVIHNLKSINAHLIQELYKLVPQQKLTETKKKPIDEIISEVRDNPKKAALTFLRLAKLGNSIKAEISVYEKLELENTKLSYKQHNIRDIVMIVLYMFFGEFNKNDVFVQVGQFFTRSFLDFESIQVALYHLIENSSKYVKQHSNVNIKFEETKDSISVLFEMESLYIKPGEREKIFLEGYSGENAIQWEKAGKGIGMNRIKRLVEINNGSFCVNCSDHITKWNNIEYSENIFIIRLPKEQPNLET